MKKAALLSIIAVLVCAVGEARAIDASDFSDLVGYTVVACTHANGEVEGADFDKPIKLANGMLFEFESYSYFYDYNPDVVVFGKTMEYQGKSITLYKLLIGDEDEIFDVRRIR